MRAIRHQRRARLAGWHPLEHLDEQPRRVPLVVGHSIHALPRLYVAAHGHEPAKRAVCGGVLTACRAPGPQQAPATVYDTGQGVEDFRDLLLAPARTRSVADVEYVGW